MLRVILANRNKLNFLATWPPNFAALFNSATRQRRRSTRVYQTPLISNSFKFVFKGSSAFSLRAHAEDSSEIKRILFQWLYAFCWMGSAGLHPIHQGGKQKNVSPLSNINYTNVPLPEAERPAKCGEGNVWSWTSKNRIAVRPSWLIPDY